ncbi:MAG: hypothetical protein IJ364_00050 [Oscillospiraceae bacterium]|nr:hypothetical protein [Oscillospiraceae bacterium]
MYGVREKSPYAGMTVKTKSDVGVDLFSGFDLSNKEFDIEDWWENVYGASWMVANGNPAAIAYAFRSGNRGLPTDNEVLYGKIGGLGFLFHVSELELPEVN